MALVLNVDAWWQRTDAGLRLRRRGDELTVDAETEAWLRKHGIAGDASEAEAKEKAPEPAAEEVEQVAPAEKPSRAQKPAKAAPVDEWRAYAKSLGIDPSGLSKAEIIAATR